MYGTVTNIRIKAGQGDALLALMREWNTERRPKVPGALNAYVFKLDSDPQDWILIGLFQDKDIQTANANDPEQDRRFRKLMEHSEAEAAWHDGQAF